MNLLMVLSHMSSDEAAQNTENERLEFKPKFVLSDDLNCG